jgi:hypothetical protein
MAAARGAVANAERRARYATVSVALVRDRPEDEGGAGGAWTPGDALGDALRVLEVAAGVLVVAAAVLLPLALVWVLAGLTWRALARRRRERALDMA